MPLPFNGPSGASKAAMEVLRGLPRRAEAVRRRCRGGGGRQHENRRPPRKRPRPKRVADRMTPEQRELYGHTFRVVRSRSQRHAEQWARLGRRRPESDRAGRASARAEPRAVERTPKRCSGSFVEKSDAEQDTLRLKLVGLS